MINVIYKDNWIEISGHANSAPKGKDLVCAGVSAIVLSATSWFKKGEAVFAKDDESNAIRIILVKKTKANQNKLSLLIKQLKALQKQYKKHISVRKGK